MEDGSHPILYFLDAIYKKHAGILARHISEVVGGDYSLILSAIHSFEINRKLPVPVPVEMKEPEKKEEEVQCPILYKIIIFYSEKYHAIFGDKNSIKPIFDKIGGRFHFNSNLSRGKGWIFSFNKLEELELELKKNSLLYTIENGPYFEKIENAPPSIPDSPAPTESNDPRIIRLNKFGRHEDTSTGLVFKEIEGVVSAYGIQKSDGEVLPISKELHLYCHKKGFPVAELDEWEEDEEYSSEEENDNDSSSSKDLSENDMTDGEDIIEEEKGAKDNSS